jgi:glycosyltransferase involved in cell wall biosynthesis
MTPKISVAIAVHNGEKFLRMQLESIYAQTLPPSEVIAIDDASTDASIAILQEYTQSKGLVYQKNECNQGVNATFEKAFSLCQGDYIAPCDQDDIWMPAKLETGYRAISRLPANEPCLVGGLTIDVDEDQKKIWQEFIPHEYSVFTNFFPCLWCGGAVQLFNRPLKEMVFPLKDSSYYDFQLGVVATILGNRLVLPTPMRLQLHHQKNATAKQGGLRFKIHKCLLPYALSLDFLQGFLSVANAYGFSLKSEQDAFINHLIQCCATPRLVFKTKEFGFKKRWLVFVASFFMKLKNYGTKR